MGKIIKLSNPEILQQIHRANQEARERALNFRDPNRPPPKKGVIAGNISHRPASVTDLDRAAKNPRYDFFFDPKSDANVLARRYPPQKKKKLKN